MIRSEPGGRLHVRTREQFLREMERVDAELTAEKNAAGRLSIDVVFAKAGYYTAPNGDFVEADTGVRCRGDSSFGGENG